MLGNILDAARRMCKRARGDDCFEIRAHWEQNGASCRPANEALETDRWQLTIQNGVSTCHRPVMGSSVSSSARSYTLRSSTLPSVTILSKTYNLQLHNMLSDVQLEMMASPCPAVDYLMQEVLKVSPINTVVSPLVLKFSLCKLADVARGQSKNELMSALGYSEEKMISNCFADFRSELFEMRMSMLIASNLYLNESINTDPKFTENSMALFGLRVNKVGFSLPKAAASFINKAMERDTLRRISDIIDEEDIDKNTTMVIVQGVHFRSIWEKPFNLKKTTEKIFRQIDGNNQKVPMMYKFENVLYSDDTTEKYKAISINFIFMVSMTIIMPDNPKDMPNLITKMYENLPGRMKKLNSNFQRQFVNIYLPRFKIKTYVDWTDFLKMIGVNLILTKSKSELEGISKNDTGDIFLSKVKQRVFLEINELGMAENDRPPSSVEVVRERLNSETAITFEANQPFYFVISMQIDQVDYDIFNGAYYGPGEAY